MKGGISVATNLNHTKQERYRQEQAARFWISAFKNPELTQEWGVLLTSAKLKPISVSAELLLYLPEELSIEAFHDDDLCIADISSDEAYGFFIPYSDSIRLPVAMPESGIGVFFQCFSTGLNGVDWVERFRKHSDTEIHRTCVLVSFALSGDYPIPQTHLVAGIDMAGKLVRSDCGWPIFFSTETDSSTEEKSTIWAMIALYAWKSRGRSPFDWARDQEWVPPYIKDFVDGVNSEIDTVYTLTESPIEKLFLDNAIDLIPGLKPQYKIGPYRVDFAIPDQRIAIELDGHQYHSTKEQRTRDAKRQRYLERNGWRVIRFTGSEVWGDASGCVEETIRLIEAIGGAA